MIPILDYFVSRRKTFFVFFCMSYIAMIIGTAGYATAYFVPKYAKVFTDPAEVALVIAAIMIALPFFSVKDEEN